MTEQNDTTYNIRISVPGGKTMTATLRTVGGKRIELDVWNEPGDPSFYRIGLVGSIDANPVEYKAVSFHPVTIP
ncbi:hypothetical protein [Curtobacterium sp. NPDC092190]|uniref:hypothetical protein n=1 Tax=Curtobacterium sp. NPDC092190 TaxID=3363973 RepID=UPI0037FE2381